MMRLIHGIRRVVKNASLWFTFFLIVYIIIVLKVLTYGSLPESVFFGFYGLAVSTYILSRFVLAYFHRSPRYDERYQPTVTFVVPAKNEQDNIAETVRRFSMVNYPLEKVEAIVVNDGSTDNTKEELSMIQRELFGRIPVTVVNWRVNHGKRHAMAEGVVHAKGEIVIFVDSDSFVHPDCIKHLVKYFVDPDVGAVSGHTNVYNQNTNLLTQMQSVRYYVAFVIYKAAESVFGSVTCCPGCCSAYRREYLMQFLYQWLYQKFFGQECTFGDDRSLTNFIIRKYKALYSPHAVAYTVVPDSFRKYMKQQQRWKKSWIRETFIAATFMWKKNPIAAISFYLYIFLALVSPIVFVRAMFWHPIQTGVLPIIYLFGLFLMIFLHGIYYRIRRGEQPWLYAILAFWFNTVILIWQLPWAFITISDGRWGTR